MKKKIAILIVVMLFAAFSAACGQNTPGQDNTLRLGMLPIEDNFPFFVAESEGLFEENGLNVELVPFNSARDRDTALEAGEVDGVTADLVAAALLKKSGTDVKVVSLTMGSTPEEGRFALLAAPESNITKPSDLQGIPVAVSNNTIIEYVDFRMLTGAGLSPENIVTESVPAIPERLEFLLNGTVKAALLPDPIATLAEDFGAKVIIDDTKLQDNLSQVVLMFTQSSLENKAAAVKKLLAVYAQAAAAVSQEPAKYQELFVAKARVPEKLANSYLAPKYSPPSVPGESEFKAVMNWMVYKGLISQQYDYESLVDNSFLEGVN